MVWPLPELSVCMCVLMPCLRSVSRPGSAPSKSHHNVTVLLVMLLSPLLLWHWLPGGFCLPGGGTCCVAQPYHFPECFLHLKALVSGPEPPAVCHNGKGNVAPELQGPS